MKLLLVVNPATGKSDTLEYLNYQEKYLNEKQVELSEKRQAVVSTAAFIQKLTASGVSVFYLSNSNQNLYPLLYRFLVLNEFPVGPMFVQKYVHLRGWAWRKISRKKSLHKRMLLEKTLELVPDKQLRPVREAAGF